MKITKRSTKEILIGFEGHEIGYIVRNKHHPKDSPQLISQHSDCVLSTGEPIGFFGREGPGSGGVSCVSWNSLGINHVAKAFGYDLMLEHQPHLVKTCEARDKKLISLLLVIALPSNELDKIKSFDDWWWLMKEAHKKGFLKPFHLMGRNCSSFAYESFRESGVLKKALKWNFDTPNRLYKHLVKSLKESYKLECYSGYLGFEPLSKDRRLRLHDKEVRYNIVISDFNKFD